MGTRGRLIVFEGAEGAGKSTQLALLRDALVAASVRVASYREPGGTPLGDAIRDLLLHSAAAMTPAAEAHLFMASRAELCMHAISPALADGVVVLLDRFFLSTYAYQVVGRGLPEDDVRAANRLATGGLVPDLTVILDVPAADGLKRASQRGGRDRIERAADDFHERVAAAFRRFSEQSWMQTHPEAGRIVRVDASGTRETVFAKVMDAVGGVLGADLMLSSAVSSARTG